MPRRQRPGPRASLYHRVAEEGSFPPDESSLFVKMLPKHTGKGRRPVAVLRALYRVWGKFRSFRKWLIASDCKALNVAPYMRRGDAFYRTLRRALLAQRDTLVMLEFQTDVVYSSQT